MTARLRCDREDKERMAERRLAKRLVSLAESDEWARCLSLLGERKSQGDSNTVQYLRGKNGDGDSLLHLAAYSSCETVLPLTTRQRALECLDIVLGADPSSVNRMASDGGSALHAAIAAASGSILQAQFDHHVDPSLDDSSESSEDGEESVEYDEGDWESENGGEMNENDPLVLPESSFSNLSSNAITLKAISLLLEHGADSNRPMHNDIGEEDLELGEFVYSREALLEQWTPFSLALVWIALASTKSELRPSPDDAPEDTCIFLPLAVIKDMLMHGADPGQNMGANAPSNGVELMASCAHCLTERMRNDTLQTHGIEIQNNSNSVTVKECLEQLLQQYAKVEFPKLSTEQAFASALIANDIEGASAILTSTRNEGQIRRWRSTCFSDLLPMPQATWCSSRERETWSLLSACVATMATASVHFLLDMNISNSTNPLSEKDAIQALEVAFSDYGMARDIFVALDRDVDDGKTEWRIKVCTAIVDAAYPPPCQIDARQMFLDRLLLRSCSKRSHDQKIINILMDLGADPDTNSVASVIQNNWRPLHFVAANRGGTSGVAMAKTLVEAGANVKVRDAQGVSPLMMALKHRNYHVLEFLWQSVTADVEDMSSNPLVSSDVLHTRLLFGEAAISIQSLPMLQEAITCLRASAAELGTPAVEKALGRLLLVCADDRSGFACVRKDENNIESLIAAISVILGIDISSGDDIVSSTADTQLLPTIETCEVSKYTILHLLLKTDRGAKVRRALLKPFCELAARQEDTEASSINLHCDNKFGSYTALHLACALDCEESIATLLHYGANVSVLDYQGNHPCDLLAHPENLSQPTRDQLFLCE